MTTLQIKVQKQLAEALQKKSSQIGISKTAYVKVLIAQDLGLAFDEQPGNLFNADRDNGGLGIPLGEFEAMLHDPENCRKNKRNT